MSSTRLTRPLASNGLRQVVPRVCAVASRRQYGAVAAFRHIAPSPRRNTVSVPSGTRKYSQQHPESKIWSFEEVQKVAKQPQSDVVIVDVREPGELQSTGHIPHAVNVPITTTPDSFHITTDEFEDRFGFARPGKGQEVVFYCKAGVRSRAAAGLARDAGWTRVGEYPGSWMDWAGKGGDIER